MKGWMSILRRLAVTSSPISEPCLALSQQCIARLGNIVVDSVSGLPDRA